MEGLAKSITERPAFQDNPDRAAHFIEVFAGSEAFDFRSRLVSSYPIARGLIEAGKIIPPLITGVLFMACKCPGSKSEAVRPKKIKTPGFFLDPWGELRRGSKDTVEDKEGRRKSIYREIPSGRIFPREKK
jgi:hypothetical protein